MINPIKNRFLTSVICFTLLLLSISILIIGPSVLEIRLINSQVYEERERLEKLYTKGQIKREIQKKFESIKNEVDFLDKIILKENKELEYITAVENIAEKNGIKISMTTSPKSKTQNQDFSELEFVFTINGTWQQIIKWLSDIESLPYYTNIKDSTFMVSSKGEKDSGQRQMAASIKASTYWLIAK